MAKKLFLSVYQQIYLLNEKLKIVNQNFLDYKQYFHIKTVNHYFILFNKQ